MSTFRNRLSLEVAKNLWVFLTLDGGLMRASAAEIGPGAGASEQEGPQAEQLHRARKQIEDQNQEIQELQEELSKERQRIESFGRIRERIQNQNRRIEGLQEELSREQRRVAALLSDSDEEAVRGYVSEEYGYEHGLPEVGLLDVLPHLDETVRTFGKVLALPADVALLQGLAKKMPGCSYFEIGSWREETAAGVSAVAREWVSVNPTDEELEGFGSLDGIFAERAYYRDGAANVARGSHAFSYANLKDRFDLAFVDGQRPRESVNLATETVFDLLKKGAGSAVVWRGYRSEPGKINWRALAGILDGCPREELDNLYHVSGTSCAVRLGGSYSRSRAGERRLPNEVFDLRLTARSALRKLVVLDDAFPNLHSAFRIAEYNAYLERWKDATVYSTASNPVSLRGEKSFRRVLWEYASVYPELGERVFRYGGKLDLSGDLAYFIFLNNAARFVDAINDHGTPFAFTLYPGGGFKLDQDDSDEKLRKAFSSPNFEKVIVTQNVTRDYLIEREFCDPGRIEFVYGGVFPLAQLAGAAPPKSYYKKDKDTFDVCFVAFKYISRSIASKGYDVFVEVAKQLAGRRGDMRFHVVGTFDESDIDVSEMGDRIKFYGPRTSGFFPGFYSRMDVILSPNVPFALFPGAFDGFPTGACMEAGLCGVGVVCTDPLDLNVAFEDGEEIAIVPHDAEAISAVVDRFHERPEDLYRMAEKGQEAFARVFGMEAQVGPRLRMLAELMGEDGPGVSGGQTR